MKAYLVTTCVLFGVLAILHVWRAIVEWPSSTVSPGFVLKMTVLVALPGILSLWAWLLLQKLSRARPGNPKAQKEDPDDSAA
jgi:hypothetical protein